MPLGTIRAALREAREMRRLSEHDRDEEIEIVLTDGIHRQTEPLLIRPEDSGTPDQPLVIRSAPDASPTICGGIDIDNWQRVSATDSKLNDQIGRHLWVAEAPHDNGRRLEFRQLWIDGKKATRARTPNSNDMLRLVDWDRQKQLATIPSTNLAGLQVRLGLEMVLLQQWEIANLRIKSLRPAGEDTTVEFHDPERRVEFEHAWPQPVFKPEGNSAFYLVGALNFLDQPGEWYQDLETGRIYLWPPANRNPNELQIIAPTLETLLQVSGTVDRPVHDIEFRGLTFAYSSWMTPAFRGHVPHQACMPMIDAYELEPKGTPDWHKLDNQAYVERIPAAVILTGTQRTLFRRCRFEHLAISGLDFISACQDATVEGCIFDDVGGNGIQLGSFGDPGIEVHLPYQPEDERVVCSNCTIANNLFRDTANEDWGGVAIGVGWAKSVNIEHNEVLDTSYTAISVGWGWTRTPSVARSHTIRANRIHRFATRMADSGAIYLLSAQPWTVVSENVIEHAPVMTPWVHDPNHYGFIYLDEGSSFTRVANNWVPFEKFIANANGPGNVWENNNPNVPEAIRYAAGLEDPYRDLFLSLPTTNADEVK